MDRRTFLHMYNEQKREESKKALYKSLEEMHKAGGSDGEFLMIGQFLLKTPASEFSRDALLGLKFSVDHVLKRKEGGT